MKITLSKTRVNSKNNKSLKTVSTYGSFYAPLGKRHLFVNEYNI